ncbi:MAG: hypothetical protein K0Q49_394 [Haloplasmataceae bacterium]|jgi:uncharacterized membrane protein YgaE (UPF0421/DUF939 family)|nr:hypothetical protein [Haloplasmataceae bacterium]
MNLIGYRTLKTAIGVVIAMYLANLLSLEYYTAAGVIVILSIQNTRKLSYNFAFQRIIACLISLFLAVIVFFFLGYSPITFGIVILLFIPISVKLKVAEGIVVNSVLVSHLLIEESISSSLLFNEIGLMLIGVLVALFLNLYMPSNEKVLKENIEFVDLKIKEILVDMSKSLKEHAVSVKEEENFRILEERLKLAENLAYTNMSNNFVFTKENYYVTYIETRNQQFIILKRIREHFERLFMTYSVTHVISDYTLEISNAINERNNADYLLEKLNNLRTSFKVLNLPTTREEFENRAMLFQYLNDLEMFLNIKKSFHQKYKN